jgi:TonB family protein
MSARVWLFAVAVALIGAPPSALADFDDGIRAYEGGDYATALQEWLPLAKSGDERAQLSVGLMYYRGEGVEADHEIALKWIRKAVKKEFAPAQIALGTMYEYGHGVKSDPDKAMKWYRAAARGGSPEGMMILAHRQLEGRIVPQDREKAFEWLVRAAGEDHEPAYASLNAAVDGASSEQLSDFVRLGWRLYQQGLYDLAAVTWRTLAYHGLADAQYMLGKLYAGGRGVLMNEVAAYKWLALAARNSKLKAEEMIKEVAEGMSAAEISKAKEQAAAWSPGDAPPHEEDHVPTAEQIGAEEPVFIKESRVEPHYPASHRISRQEGRVVLLAVIREDGTIGDLSILRSNMMHSDFEKSAYGAVSQWRYQPAMKDGKPVEVQMKVWVSFTIH